MSCDIIMQNVWVIDKDIHSTFSMQLRSGKRLLSKGYGFVKPEHNLYLVDFFIYTYVW